MKYPYTLHMNGHCNEAGTVLGTNYRFTVLTPQMIRMEYCEDGAFENRATQKVINRNFETPEFSIKEDSESLEIITKFLHVHYNKKPFTKQGLTIQLKNENAAHRNITWYFSQTSETLKGTARTLDGANGEIPLEEGILSKNGYTLIDDSRSLVLEENGTILPRKKGIYDIYFLAYPSEHKKCLQDFFKLCGQTPLLPRYALGNWWSRYYAYSGMEYLELMEQFKIERVPLSVSVLDMDWHITKVAPKYGIGWTGYTWNKELFPDPKLFMDQLHERGLKITLNVHPADGVRGYEDMYEDMAKQLDVDYQQEEPIPFDITNPKFMEAYFKYLHHPNEEAGVDFWWIDWQQGNNTRIEGLDPLWMLNHYHFLDSGRNGKRPLTFSRYAGIGSHRYPIGFSGDTVISWDSLHFQPYFTSTASNVGYGWWSHDIGGHMAGKKDDEMMVRWVQFGVFSPIMRLHSTKNIFNGKEPWNYNDFARHTINRFLRLRHQLLPYLYTMNARSHFEGEPLVQPMYYEHPKKDEAYHVKNQFYFGSELIVAPITTPIDSSIQKGKVKAWLPEGTYIDLFNGLIYKGNRMLNLYRGINEMPVLAKAGAILPLNDQQDSMDHGTEIPTKLEIKVFAGADGHFSLYEDDGETMAFENGEKVVTEMEFKWDEKNQSSFRIEPVQDDYNLLPTEREYILQFIGVNDCDDILITCNDEQDSYPIEVPFKKYYNEKMKTIEIKIDELAISKGIYVAFVSKLILAENAIKERIFEFHEKAQIEFDLKQKIYALICEKEDISILSDLQAMGLSENLYGALLEILLA